MSYEEPATTIDFDLERMGANIRAALARSGKSRSRFCREAGISLSVLYRYTSGLNAPTIFFAIAMARAFGMTTEELFGDCVRLPQSTEAK